VEYTYDAWGNILTTTGSMASTLGTHNPPRYRGYVYDHETQLYYLQSRYYNPAMGRFINADDYPSTGQGLTGNNMFAYCGNNPISRADDSGEFWNIVIGAVVGTVVSGLVSIATQVIENKGFDNINWGRVGVAAAAGAVSGAFAATGIPVGGQTIINAAIGTVSSIADTYVDKGSAATAADYVSSAFTGFVLGAAGGLLGGNGSGTKHLSKSAGRLFQKVGTALGDVLDNGIKATGKTILKAGKYYYSQVAKQSIQCGQKAILPIIVSNIPTAAYNTWGALN
jgi:RHS repeat-associated protein